MEARLEPQLETRVELRAELRPVDTDALRDLRHDLASVASALDTIISSKHLKLSESASEIVRLSLDKLLKSIEAVDGWIEIMNPQ